MFKFYIFLAAGIILLVIKIAEYFINNSDKRKIEKLKKDSFKINVQLKDISVLANSWSNEREPTKSEQRTLLYDKLTNNDVRESKYETVNMVLLNYNFKFEGNVYQYSKTINVEKEKLRVGFVFQKETVLYFNPKTHQMYLDLEFLGD